MASAIENKHAGSGFRISKRALPYVLSLPALLVCIGILIPFVTAVVNSLQRYRLSQPWARKFNWGENYWSFFTDPSFWNTLKVSLSYAFLTVTLELLLGLGIALLLQRRSAVNNFISIMLLLPLMIAPALAALMWKLMTNPGFGILSYFASLIGLENFRWASSPDTALLTVVLVDIWVYTPFIMILLLAGLRSLPTQPFEAAALGAADHPLGDHLHSLQHLHQELAAPARTRPRRSVRRLSPWKQCPRSNACFASSRWRWSSSSSCSRSSGSS